MDLLKPRTWTASDIALLKIGSALVGVAVGLSLPKRCRSYAPLLVGGAVLLTAKPLIEAGQAEAAKNAKKPGNRLTRFQRSGVPAARLARTGASISAFVQICE